MRPALTTLLLAACAFGCTESRPAVSVGTMATDTDAAIEEQGATDAGKLPSDGGNPAADPDAAVDAGPPPIDCPARDFGKVGGECDDHGDCGTGGVCLNKVHGLGDEGYCVRTCATDTVCGEGASCAKIDSLVPELINPNEPPPDRLCLPDCCDDVACPSGQICQARFAGLFEVDRLACGPGDSDASDGDACRGPQDCNLESICNLGPTSPGGYCFTLGCDPKDDGTCAPGGDGRCFDFGDPEQSVCVDGCKDDADCRTAEGYRCRDVGPGPICVHPVIGERCTADDDCGNPPWRCDTTFSDGHCTFNCMIATKSCGDDGLCHEDGFCVDQCDPAQPNCRPGYSCEPVLGGHACLEP